MSDCIFCKIISNKVEASFIYRGVNCSAFMDIHPMTPGHLLIVPNRHSERFVDVNPNDAAEMFKLAQDSLIAIKKTTILCDGANIFLSDGAVAGQEVLHSHLHVAPRFIGDGQKVGFMNDDPDQANRFELDEFAKQISGFLNSSLKE